MSKLLPALATRAAVVATTTAAAALLAALPAVTTADAISPSAGPVTAPTTVTGPVGADDPVPTIAAAAPAPAAPAVAAQVDTVAGNRPATTAGARSSALALALGKLGTPYRWGAAGPGAFDCSGLVQWSFSKAGLDVPRTSRAQSQVGSRVAKSDLRPGDLVFFYSPVSHVGIYAGDGEVVHASNSGKPVKMGKVDAMPFHSARRL